MRRSEWFVIVSPIGGRPAATSVALARSTAVPSARMRMLLRFSTVPLPGIVTAGPGNQEKGFNDSFSIQFASPMKVDS